MRLHGYWRSGAAYRLRIALGLKGVVYDQATYDLRKSEQQATSYAMLQPQKLVPALETEAEILIQSPAILEWLEEAYPDPALLPASADDRAKVRAMAAIVACDIHPLNNLRVLTALRSDLSVSDAQVSAWIARWIGEGFAALERLIERYGGEFAFGNTPTLADCCIVPQLYSAERFGVSLAPYPRLVKAADATRRLPTVAAAHPDRQPDADQR